ncbi:hypothetical protein ILYODFUR_036116 [Ilyodon furcidens]|uniref:Uncharacterized protein n=1 Tax=Ilyodon furcidens TaxID=33524 RepID=A0ABV0UDZ6_9TELE
MVTLRQQLLVLAQLPSGTLQHVSFFCVSASFASCLLYQQKGITQVPTLYVPSMLVKFQTASSSWTASSAPSEEVKKRWFQEFGMDKRTDRKKDVLLSLLDLLLTRNLTQVHH